MLGYRRTVPVPTCFVCNCHEGERAAQRGKGLHEFPYCVDKRYRHNTFFVCSSRVPLDAFKREEVREIAPCAITRPNGFNWLFFAQGFQHVCAVPPRTKMQRRETDCCRLHKIPLKNTTGNGEQTFIFAPTKNLHSDTRTDNVCLRPFLIQSMVGPPFSSLRFPSRPLRYRSSNRTCMVSSPIINLQ